jgi:hypothetical protein
VARKCFHGQRGELRQRYREGQEDQLGALGLVVNALVLWNTRYMDAALSQLRSQGAEVNPEDVARLSPLADKHFNVLGRYHFTVNDSILRGDLRPLRDPNAPRRTRLGCRPLAYVLVPMIVGPLPGVSWKRQPASLPAPSGDASRKGILRTFRPSKNHSTKKNAPELDYSSFYGKTGAGTRCFVLEVQRSS